MGDGVLGALVNLYKQNPRRANAFIGGAASSALTTFRTARDVYESYQDSINGFVPSSPARISDPASVDSSSSGPRIARQIRELLRDASGTVTTTKRKSELGNMRGSYRRTKHHVLTHRSHTRSLFRAHSMVKTLIGALYPPLSVVATFSGSTRAGVVFPSLFASQGAASFSRSANVDPHNKAMSTNAAGFNENSFCESFMLPSMYDRLYQRLGLTHEPTANPDEGQLRMYVSPVKVHMRVANTSGVQTRLTGYVIVNKQDMSIINPAPFVAADAQQWWPNCNDPTTWVPPNGFAYSPLAMAFAELLNTYVSHDGTPVDFDNSTQNTMLTHASVHPHWNRHGVWGNFYKVLRVVSRVFAHGESADWHFELPGCTWSPGDYLQSGDVVAPLNGALPTTCFAGKTSWLVFKSEAAVGARSNGPAPGVADPYESALCMHTMNFTGTYSLSATLSPVAPRSAHVWAFDSDVDNPPVEESLQSFVNNQFGKGEDLQPDSIRDDITIS